LPRGRPERRRLPGVASASVQSLRRLTETISSRDPTLMVKERGPRRKTVQGRWRGGTMPPRRNQTKGARSSSAGSCVLELCLGNVFNRKFTSLQKFVGQDNWSPKTASAGERPVSSLGCAQKLRSTKGYSSDQVTAAARARSASLRRRCSLFDCTIRLRMICHCLAM
jgi:hypothetical protein